MRKNDADVSLDNQAPDRYLVRGRRRTLCLDACVWAVVSSSATGAVYRPLEASRQQLFSSGLALGETAETPGTATIYFPLYLWADVTVAVVLAFRKSAAPRWPGALLYGRALGVASSFSHFREIICLFLGTREPDHRSVRPVPPSFDPSPSRESYLARPTKRIPQHCGHSCRTLPAPACPISSRYSA